MPVRGGTAKADPCHLQRLSPFLFSFFPAFILPSLVPYKRCCQKQSGGRFLDCGSGWGGTFELLSYLNFPCQPCVRDVFVSILMAREIGSWNTGCQ